jgi:type IV pilus assembly protein PilB
MQRSHKRLGEILIEKSLLSATQLEEALAEQVRTKTFLGEILVRRGFVRQEDFLRALSEQFSLPVVRLHDRYIDWSVVSRFTSSLILDHACFPLARDDDSATIAIVNPLDFHALECIESQTRGLRLKLVLAMPQDIAEVQERYKQYLRKEAERSFGQP